MKEQTWVEHTSVPGKPTKILLNVMTGDKLVAWSNSDIWMISAQVAKKTNMECILNTGSSVAAMQYNVWKKTGAPMSKDPNK